MSKLPRTTRWFLLFIIISILCSICFIDSDKGSKSFIISFFVILIALCSLYLILSLPIVKGKLGEAKVSLKINKLVKKYGGFLLNNVMIFDDKTQKSSQIDHIYISNYGIFSIETKNYAGRIYGSNNQKDWTQVLAYGRVKNKLYNPVKQNATHIMRLCKVLSLNEKLFRNVVIFVQGNTSYIDSDNVYQLKDIKHLISKNNKNIISNEEILSIKKQIENYSITHKFTSKEHIQEIKTMISNIDKNVCPRCGGNLVLRTSKDGKQFYGCSNFPKCKFTKK